MNEPHEATAETKTALENSITWMLGERLGVAPAPIVTSKYMTSNNLLVQLTSCAMPELSVPRLKVQVYQRVTGGVHETGYNLYGDHRLAKYENDMIFGSGKGGDDGSTTEPVTEEEAQQLLGLVNGLGNARQTV